MREPKGARWIGAISCAFWGLAARGVLGLANRRRCRLRAKP